MFQVGFQGVTSSVLCQQEAEARDGLLTIQAESCNFNVIRNDVFINHEREIEFFPGNVKTDTVTLFFSICGNNSAVECNLAKVEVAGSNPVSRSKGGIAKW